MKKIGIITTNKVLAQSLSKAAKAQPELEFSLYPLLNLDQAALDVEVLKVDVALIDVMNGAATDKSAVLMFCEKLRQTAPACRLLLLVSQTDVAGRKMAVEAVRINQADDFVFYDTSLDYLFAKLAAI